MAESPRDASYWLPVARAGSRDALGQALEACRAYLLQVANQELGPELRAKGGASDLVQQTFLEAQRDFPQFQGETETELLAWLRQALLHNLANFQRRYRETDKRCVAREISLTVDDSASPDGPEIRTDSLSPSGHAMANERSRDLESALARLPEDYRQVLRLRYDEDLPFEDIARLLNRSANAVRKLWVRAIERLREEMREPS
jgi:RNA polymerase sigma-70 factor (ECF subfamily)